MFRQVSDSSRGSAAGDLAYKVRRLSLKSTAKKATQTGWFPYIMSARVCRRLLPIKAHSVRRDDIDFLSHEFPIFCGISAVGTGYFRLNDWSTP